MLLQYYSVLQTTTPVLLCTTKYYSVQHSTTLYYTILLQYYSVLQNVLLQYYSALYYILKKSRAEHLCAEISLQQVRLFAAALNMASFRTKKCDGYCSHDFYGNHGTRGPQSHAQSYRTASVGYPSSYLYFYIRAIFSHLVTHSFSFVFHHVYIYTDSLVS